MRIQGLGIGVEDLGFIGFRIWDLGFGVIGS